MSRHFEYREVQPLGDYKASIDATKGELLLVTCLMLRQGKHQYCVVDANGTVLKSMTEIFVSEPRSESLPFFKS